MIHALLASPILSLLVPASWRAPLRCPYCAAGMDCSIKWAFYERFAHGASRIRVQRYFCRIARRTFSLPPDALLPYHNPATATILGWLTEIFVNGTGVATVARMSGVARSTVRGIRAGFEKAAAVLRLPGHEGAIDAAAFLKHLTALGPDGVAALFATWKELEPKHSIVGVYPR